MTFEVHSVFLHGAIVLLIGLIGGYPYTRAINKNHPEAERAWRLFHTATTMGGVMLIALGSCLHIASIPPAGGFWIMLFSIVSAYSFVGGMLLAAVFRSRGLKWEGTALNRLIYGFYSVGSTTSVVFGIILIYQLLTLK